jgi:hypothetical protein
MNEHHFFRTDFGEFRIFPTDMEGRIYNYDLRVDGDKIVISIVRRPGNLLAEADVNRAVNHEPAVDNPGNLSVSYTLGEKGFARKNVFFAGGDAGRRGGSAHGGAVR